MDAPRLVRLVDTLLTAKLLVFAVMGVVLAWALGLLAQLSLALLLVALVAPRVYDRAQQRHGGFGGT